MASGPAPVTNQDNIGRSASQDYKECRESAGFATQLQGALNTVGRWTADYDLSDVQRSVVLALPLGSAAGAGAATLGVLATRATEASRWASDQLDNRVANETMHCEESPPQL
jgi:hypothetical protein